MKETRKKKNQSEIKVEIVIVVALQKARDQGDS